MRPKILIRKLHRFGAVLTVLPVVIVVVTGILLLLKKEVGWIQPPTRKGTMNALGVSFDAILAAARTEKEAGITSWDDVDRLDVRPGKGVVKIRGKNRWEIQVDTATGKVLQTAYRRSDLIESIHDGTFFHDAAKLWVFLPSGLLLFGLWLSGVYLWLLPWWGRRARKAGRK